MSRNKITFIFLFIPAFLFLQGCQDNIILPDTVNHLQAPRLLYPPDDTTDVDIPMTFSWERDNTIKDYVLQISTDSLFDSIAYIYHGRTTNIRDVTGLNNRTKYYWRVNATNGYGEYHWSNVRKFTTGKFCNGTPIVEYSGKTYRTVQIGRQCWLRENLDVGIMIHNMDTSKDNGIIEKYCYNDDTTYCNTYGGLYTWQEAMQYSTMEGTKGICPVGWHIPKISEFVTLCNTMDRWGNSLKAVGQGSGDGAGTNMSGFSALLAGMCTPNHGCASFCYSTYFWSSHGSSSSTDAIYMLLRSTITEIYWFYRPKESGLSIRCLKD